MPKTEDQVRGSAEKILGLDDGETEVVQGTGQITTFNTLGFTGKNDKPDGWYLPNDKSKAAIILEAKAESVDISKKQPFDEIQKNIKIVETQYSHSVGILYNGSDIRVWKDGVEVTSTVSPNLENKSYYLAFFAHSPINKQKIYNATKRINDSLHVDFKMTDLTDRMIFTACALVAQRYNPSAGLQTQKGQPYAIVHAWINHNLALAISSGTTTVHSPSGKLDILVQEFNKITPSVTANTHALDGIIDAVCEIAAMINSTRWNGEDVMAIFFNEFNRYRKKSDMGQVLTPDHITSFMYRLIDVSKDDRVLDAACGTGAFLVKAMCNMITESGGYNTEKAKAVRNGQLFGIEVDRRVFALACANMLIHKDGKANLDQSDSRLPAASAWIKSKGITKVLMNPPFERTYGCLKIVENVLDSVPIGTLCAFILPDKKLEKDGGFKFLKKHTLKTIVKLPEDLFFGVGNLTSIFVFEAGKPQGDKDVLGYYIEDDGLEAVKNKGRQDVRNLWPAKEDYWIKAIQTGNEPKFGTKQIIHPAKNRLSYQPPPKPFEIFEEDFTRTLINHEMFKRGIDAKSFSESIVQRVLYASNVSCNGSAVRVEMEA